VRLQGQTAIITGAGRGIGRAIAERFAQEGAQVALVSRTEKELNEVAEQINGAGGRASVWVGDTACLDDVRENVAGIEKLLGPVDVLVNNAGVHNGFGPIWEIDPDDFWKDMTVNVRGVFNFCHEMSRRMVERKQGRIINMVGGGFSRPSPNFSGYGASKTAVMRLTETMAAELKDHGVGVFAMSPGLVKTPLNVTNMNRPDVQKYLDLKGMFDKGRDIPPTVAAGIATALASGSLDALTGRVVQPSDDLGQLESETDRIVAEDLMTLRVRT
jgi:NAD(P)-dependent dehydrogenase (short-subunit alcohol dehydrogenase family)